VDVVVPDCRREDLPQQRQRLVDRDVAETTVELCDPKRLPHLGRQLVHLLAPRELGFELRDTSVTATPLVDLGRDVALDQSRRDLINGVVAEERHEVALQIVSNPICGRHTEPRAVTGEPVGRELVERRLRTLAIGPAVDFREPQRERFLRLGFVRADHLGRPRAVVDAPPDLENAAVSLRRPFDDAARTRLRPFPRHQHLPSRLGSRLPRAIDCTIDRKCQPSAIR
jgi:hypothetical protein